jgi:ribosome modulation factor
MEFEEHPLLGYANLAAIALREGEKGGASVTRCVAHLRASLERAGERPDVGESEMHDHMAGVVLDLARARLIHRVDGGFALTERGSAVIAEHPGGVDRTVLSGFPEYRRNTERRRATPAMQPHLGAHLEGYCARLDGAALTDNPYQFDSSRHLVWEAGWQEAMEDIGQGREEGRGS